MLFSSVWTNFLYFSRKIIGMPAHGSLTLFRPSPPSPHTKKMNNLKPFKLRAPNLATFPKSSWEHFKVVVTCTSTLTLPWQPSFNKCFFFQNLHFFFYKRPLFSTFTYWIFILHSVINIGTLSYDERFAITFWRDGYETLKKSTDVIRQ